MGQIDIILKPGKEASIMRKHPWVFSGAIQKIAGEVTEGQVVRVLDSKSAFLALGHYQIGSIAVRILSFKEKDIDSNFWKEKISSAYSKRQALGLTNNPDTNVFRLVHGEGDEMPGLIVDFYNGTVVTQFHSVGMYLAKNDIVEAIKGILGNKVQAIYDKSENTLPFKAPVKPTNGYLWGNSSETNVVEHGNTFHIDWVEGQKTGFFIDQRENRQLVKEYAHNRRVLNMFAYTGGFSVYAMRGGAEKVISVDSSKKAIELTHQNLRINFPEARNHESLAVDAFEYLGQMKHNEFNLVILDPPAFAKHNEALKNALQAYKRINQVAIEKIAKGGIIFTFSCSQVVSKDDFRKSVFAAAANAGRSVSILHQLTQPSDHAVSIFHPEGEYLKGLVLYIE